jgi:uncharacterized coiled-coil protein SlyX
MVKNISTRSSTLTLPAKCKRQLLGIIKDTLEETEIKYRLASCKYFETRNTLYKINDVLDKTRKELDKTSESLDKLKRKHSTVMNNIRLSQNTENGKRRRINNEIVLNYNGNVNPDVC